MPQPASTKIPFRLMRDEARLIRAGLMWEVIKHHHWKKEGVPRSRPPGFTVTHPGLTRARIAPRTKPPSYTLPWWRPIPSRPHPGGCAWTPLKSRRAFWAPAWVRWFAAMVTLSLAHLTTNCSPTDC